MLVKLGLVLVEVEELDAFVQVCVGGEHAFKLGEEIHFLK
jgi:hypothetical protein